MRLCIIDTIGLVYDGTTLTKKGLGGSESAVILMSKELAKLGFDVTVFNNCEDENSNPGIYDNVKFRPIFDLNLRDETFDIAISSRTVRPFVPEKYYDWARQQKDNAFPPELFEHVRKTSKLKVLWCHDTFLVGDELLEELVVDSHIDEIFTLSDFHTSYITNCNHGRRRMFEVLKNKIFQTRNGIQLYKDWIDVTKKDKNLFVYNASFTKGMLPLVTRIWEPVKRNIPEAKLIVIGGFYRFRTGAAPDQQELDWIRLKNDYENRGLDIIFTGVISQKEISDILEKASYFVYPASFPETFGISTLEALAHNVTPITCRFGALEETAIDIASYKIDYPIEPNNLFPEVNIDEQCHKFIDMTIRSYYDQYLHQQKMNACNIVKEVCTWDTIALEWKEHFYRKLGGYLSVEETRKVKYIRERVHKIFNRRFCNVEDFL